MALITFLLNQQSVAVNVDPATLLLDVLRDELGLTGTKQGCDYEGECGACTVLLDGRTIRSCLTPVGKVAGRAVSTVEGLGDPDRLHPLQAAFIETGAVQCGYCTPGMLMAAKALLDRESKPTHDQVLEALEGNLCRCTGYKRILMAVSLAAARMRGEQVHNSPEPIIGGHARRSDSIDKVTGHAEYVEDVVMPGLLHAKVLRSPHYHAHLRGLNSEKAAQLPGVVRIFTAADIPGENGFSEYSKYEPVLTPIGDTVKMLGAPVALVVATSAEEAQVGVEAIEVDYEPLPHTFDIDETLQADALPIYEGGNVLSSLQVTDGDLEAAFKQSDLILEAQYNTSYQEHAALEREAALGYIDEAGRLTVVSGNHEPHWQQEYIAAMLNLEPGQVRVITPPTGGSFGNRQDPWPLLATGLTVHWLRRPVRLAFSRRESFDASPKRHPYRVDFRIGASRDGRLRGIRTRVSANTGGYDAHGNFIPSNALTFSASLYPWQAIDAYAQSVYTNGPKSGAFRSFGAAQSAFALECALDELAQALGQDPLELRTKNALHPSSGTLLGCPVSESLGYAEVLDAIRPHYLAFKEEAAAFNARESALRKGFGLAGMWGRFGKSGSLRIEAQVELASDGHFVVYFSTPDYGQGTNTVMPQLAAETLGVSRDRIEHVNADTAHTPDSGIIGASRSTYWVGNAVCSAAHNLKQAIVATAAEILDCPPSSLTLSDESVIGSNGGSVALTDVAQEFDRTGQSRRVTGLFDLSPHFPQETRLGFTPHFVACAHLAEVIVNLGTGEVQVLRVVAAHDVGRVINPLDAQGQVEGAILLGVGAALMEEYIPGASTGYGDYYLPTIKSMPEIEVLLIEVPSLRGPLGAKGLGEPALLPAAPAIINAVSRAVGARIRESPATPERVLRAIGNQEKECSPK